MTETEEGGVSATGMVRRRLTEARWVLVAAAVAIVALGYAGDLSFAWIALAVAFVVLVAALARRKTSRRAREEADAAATLGFQGLSAQALAEAVPDPMIVFDQHGIVVTRNEAARSAFGKLDAGTLLNLRFRTPEFQDLLATLLAGGAGPLICEYVERVPIERWFRIAGTAVGEGSGLYVLVFKDQSEIRRIDRMRADFIANASHELRTPLASIAGFIDTLRGPARNDPKAREQFLQIMQNQTARMARLIDDLLSLSRLEMKTYAPAPGKIDVRPLVESVIDSLRHLAADNGVAISKEISSDPVEVRGNGDELTQGFENLLENAIKYGQSGGRVDVSVIPAEPGTGTGPRVSFTDYGPGIAEEHIPRVTERFYRVDVETSRSQKGTGLGLAIVKHILTRHNARLTIKSKIGEGATFTVNFPST